jgi:hypothetical protein
VAPLQIDPHHDGIILGAAIGSSSGHIGPAGAFSQYGPLSPLIQGFFLNIFGNSMLNLRYFAALNALLISYLLYKLVSKFTLQRNALLISSTWIFTSAIWSTTFPGALLAWPSMISTAVILAAMNILTRVLLGKNIGKLSENVNLFAAGILLGLTGFARQQTWLAAVIAAIILIVHFGKIKQGLICYVSGAVFALAGIFIWLTLIGSLRSYINQVIVWPLGAYSTLGANNNYNRYQFASYLIQSLVFVSVLYFVALTKRFIRSTKIRFIATLSISLFIVFNGFWIAKQSQWKASIRVILGEPQEKLILSLSYFACISSIGLSLYFLFKLKNLNQSLRIKFAIAILGLVGVIQLYPQPDVLHLWWVAPIFLPSALFATEIISHKFAFINVSNFVYTLIVFCIVGLFLATKFIYQPWTEYELPVMKGTYAFESKAKDVNTFDEIQKYIKIGKTSFDCPDGIYAVSDGDYNAADEWFVNWGMLKSESPNYGDIRIICYKGKDFAKTEAKRLGMLLKDYVESSNPNVNFAVLIRK